MPCECKMEKWTEKAEWEDAFPEACIDIRRVRVPGGWLYERRASFYLGVSDHRGDGIEGESVSICFVPHPCGGA